MRGNSRAVLLLAAAMLLISIPTVAQPSQDLITLDEFMNATEVKALVKDGITEAAHLTIGGYSYGGLNAR